MNCRQMIHKEEGFVLVTAMVMLLVLTLLGTFALNSTSLELLISGNDRIASQTFYNADGGVQAGVELIEQNVGCPNGFETVTSTLSGVDLYSTSYALSPTLHEEPTSLTDIPSDTNRVIRIAADPANRVDTEPHTNIAVYGTSKYLPGSGTEMVAGYEKTGTGAARGGSMIEYDVHSQHRGVNNSEAIIVSKWRHVIGQEGVCNY